MKKETTGDLLTSRARGWGKKKVDVSFSFTCSTLILMFQACTLAHACSSIFENNICIRTGYSWRVRPYIAESKNLALAIGKWKLSIWEYRAYCMICLNAHQTIAYQCAIPNAPNNLNCISNMHDVCPTCC